ncbi:MAG: efflux RND transporter permease subunit [Bacteroidales bacterium]|nr:efflux RND transporter permease subunit [Bacteroidales bacterium]
MRLPKLAIDNTSFTWMLFIFLAVIGIRALLFMPRTENPEVTVPGSSIIVVMPGASTIDMEQMVALPIEETVNELEDIKNIKTSVRGGLAVISVEFEFNTDADEKYNEVVQQVNGIRNTLPNEILSLDMWQWTIADLSMIQLALVSSTASYAEIEQEADRLSQELEKNRNIRKVSTFGLPEQQVHISLDLGKMAMVNTSLDQVIKSIQSNNASIPGGDVRIGYQNMNVRTSGGYNNLDEIRNTVVNSYNGKLIYLDNIANIGFGYESLSHITRYDGLRCIFITVSQKEGLNVLSTAREIDPVIESFAEKLPDDMQLETVFEQSDKVRDRINGFTMNLIQGIVLVGIVIFLSLGFRSSLIVVLAIPLSIIIGLGFIDLAGFGLQQISIAGLVVALGLLVDNSIVVVENIDRYRSLGKDAAAASVEATSEIGWPVLAATITTVLAFVPIALMPDRAGEFIKSLPVSITITLSVSLLIALALTPVITSRIFRNTRPGSGKVRGIRWLLKWIIEHPFRGTLRTALKRPFVVVILALIFLGISLYMFRYVGVSFFPKAEQPNLLVQATLPEGSDLTKTDEVARYIERVLDTTPGVKYYATNVGHGNPQIYYNVLPRRMDETFADIYVELYYFTPASFSNILEGLRRNFNKYPGARIRVKDFEQGPPIDAPVQIYLNGRDLDILRNISADVEGFIHEQPGAINIENQFVKTNTEVYFDVNKDKANLLGVPLVEIDRTIRTSVTGLTAASFRNQQGKEFDMVLKMKSDKEFKLEDLDQVYVASLSGKQIPIKQLVNVRFLQVPSSITRMDMERTAEIRADIRPGFTLNEVIDPVIEQLEGYQMPSGYSYRISGELEGRREAFGGMYNAVIIAIISIFSVLVLQFRSIRQPLIVFLAIPFAVTGMIWALYLANITFSFTAFVGLTSLAGIVVNNSIILVDYINKLRAKGGTLDEALREAAETRFTPIVLTAFTTIGGLLPLTLRGGTLWAPMGWTIIGGLLVSTVLTLVLVPVFYKILEKKLKFNGLQT